MHIWIDIYMCMFVWCMCMSMSMSMFIYACVYVYVRMYVYINVYCGQCLCLLLLCHVFVCIYSCVYVYVCICYMYVYIICMCIWYMLCYTRLCDAYLYVYDAHSMLFVLFIHDMICICIHVIWYVRHVYVKVCCIWRIYVDMMICMWYGGMAYMYGWAKHEYEHEQCMSIDSIHSFAYGHTMRIFAICISQRTTLAHITTQTHTCIEHRRMWQ